MQENSRNFRHTQTNIFKQISNLVKDPSAYLNIVTAKSDIRYNSENPKDPNYYTLPEAVVTAGRGNECGALPLLCQSFNSDILFKWELYVKNKLDKITLPINNCSEIFDEYSDSSKVINYELKSPNGTPLTLLRFCLRNCKNNSHLILNELYSFVSSLSTIYNFIHGNLNIDNIFVCEEELTFYIIDFKYSNIKKYNQIRDSYKKSIDMNSLHKSIKENFLSDSEIVIYFNKLNKVQPENDPIEIEPSVRQKFRTSSDLTNNRYSTDTIKSQNSDDLIDMYIVL